MSRKKTALWIAILRIFFVRARRARHLLWNWLRTVWRVANRLTDCPDERGTDGRAAQESSCNASRVPSISLRSPDVESHPLAEMHAPDIADPAYRASSPSLRIAEEGNITYGGCKVSPETPLIALPPHLPGQDGVSVRLQPIHQFHVARYKRNIDVRHMKNLCDGRIPAFREQYTHTKVEGGWKRVIHTEGALYFIHEEQRTCTEADISEPSILAQIDKAVDQVENLYARAGKERPPYHELVLERSAEQTADSSVALWGYYIVDHEQQTLLWAQQQSIYALVNRQMFISDVQIGYALKSGYWNHIAMYPRPLSQECIDEVYSFATMYIGELLFSPDTTLCPYNLERMKTMLEVMDRLYKFPSLKRNPGFVVVVAQALNVFGNIQFHHYHGEPGARLSFGQSVYGPLPSKTRRSLTFRILSLILWRIPSKSVQQLESTYVDEVLTLSHWQRFISSQRARWQSTVTFSMFLAAFDLAFLAIPTVILSTGNSGSWTWAQRINCWSTVMLFASIAMNFLIRDRYSSVDGLNVAPVVKFFDSQKRRAGLLMEDFETLAVLHSLPIGCVLWGSILAVASFASWSFETSQITISDVIILWSLSVVIIFVAILVWAGVFWGVDSRFTSRIMKRKGRQEI